MSGRRTRQLRRECSRRLGRYPAKASGHVMWRSAVQDVQTKSGRLLRRFWQALKPAKGGPQLDEFRFFKRHGCTPQEHQTQLGMLAAKRRAERERQAA